MERKNLICRLNKMIGLCEIELKISLDPIQNIWFSRYKILRNAQCICNKDGELNAINYLKDNNYILSAKAIDDVLNNANCDNSNNNINLDNDILTSFDEDIDNNED